MRRSSVFGLYWEKSCPVDRARAQQITQRRRIAIPRRHLPVGSRGNRRPGQCRQRALACQFRQAALAARRADPRAHHAQWPPRSAASSRTARSPASGPRRHPLGHDGPQALGAIAAHAGQHHADGAASQRLGQRPEEGVDLMGCPGCWARDGDGSPSPRTVSSVPGAIHVHAFGLDRAVLGCLQHGQPGVRLQQRWQCRDLLARHVLHDDQRHAMPQGKGPQKVGQRLQAARRRAQADHGHRRSGGRAAVQAAQSSWACAQYARAARSERGPVSRVAQVR